VPENSRLLVQTMGPGDVSVGFGPDTSLFGNDAKSPPMSSGFASGQQGVQHLKKDSVFVDGSKLEDSNLQYYMVDPTR